MVNTWSRPLLALAPEDSVPIHALASSTEVGYLPSHIGSMLCSTSVVSHSHVYGLGRSVLRQDEGTGGIDAMVALDGYSGRDGDLVQHFAGFGRCRKFQTDLRHSTVGIGKDVVGEKHFTGDIVDGDVFAEAGVS